RSVGPVDSAVADDATGLRVFVDGAEALPTVANVLADAAAAARGASRGPVQLCLIAAGLPGDVEMDLGQDFPISPQIKGALKSLEGVITVEEL
ncbi:MAG: hypothetical protein AAF408_06005, partial [Pseudomonadota bacterium]